MELTLKSIDLLLKSKRKIKNVQIEDTNILKVQLTTNCVVMVTLS